MEDVDIAHARRAKEEKAVLVRFAANTGVKATVYRRSENDTADFLQAGFDETI